MKKKLLYLWKKLLLFFLSVWILSAAVFYISRLAPGDPLISYYGERAEKMDTEERKLAEQRLGLNDSITTQYLRWLEHAARGEFGISYKYKTDVLEVIGDRIGNTLVLGGSGFLLIFFLALLLGIFCAGREGSLVDRIICKTGTAASCIPEFWLALVLILIFSAELKLFPSSGAYTFGREKSVLDGLWHLILPLSVVVLEHLWYYAYLIRNRLLEEMRKDYVLLARARGCSVRSVLLRHCLRNVFPAYISLMAVSVPHIIGGTYIVETVFSYPGIGTLSYESARYHDYNLLMVLCLISGAAVILANMAAQMINERIDPRFRTEEKAMEVNDC